MTDPYCSKEDDLLHYYAILEYEIKQDISMYVPGLVHIDQYMKIFAKIQEITHIINECKRIKMDDGYIHHMQVAHAKFINDLHLT